jgi:proline iminopeptidase
MQRFVAEVGPVRRAFGLARIHLLGHSWGGWLAIEYLLTHLRGVLSVVLASTLARSPPFVAEASRLKAALPPSISQTLQRYEASADFHHPDDEAAALECYKRHLCRLDPWPEPVLRTMRPLEGHAIDETMNGPHEFLVIGTLKDWDRIDRLSEMTVPPLITVGRYDEMTPTCAETMHRRIPHVQMRVFERSSHTAHLEETETSLQVVADFLRRVETGQDH